MPAFMFPGLQGPHVQAAAKGPELQTVQEAEYERLTVLPDAIQDEGPQLNDKRRLEQNPSQRPLDRIAHDPADAYGRQSEAVKRSVYAQEGDVGPSDFKETVAELLKQEEYGVFRLVVPSVELGRREFDEYVAWLNRVQRQRGRPPRRSVYGLPVVPPFSLASKAWTCLMTFVDLTWTAFGVPINVAFCSIEYGRFGTACTATDLTFGIVYAVNLLFSFNLGMLVVNGHRRKVVVDGVRVAWYYMRYGRFVLDLAATVPFVYLVVVLAISGGQGYNAKWVNAVSLIRLIRLLRLVSVSKVIYIDSALGPEGWLSRYVGVSSLYVLMVAFQTVVLINLFACILVLLAYMHGLDTSWMTAVTWADVVDSSNFYQWYCAVYWVITTTTTTGFGDFSPRWWAEQVVIGLAMVGGMIAFGLLVGSVANALARADTTSSRLQNHIKKISQINSWLSACNLQPHKKLKLQEYFAQLYVDEQSAQYGEAELFEDLPPYLRFEVASDLALPLVRQVHALRDLAMEVQPFIAAHLRPLRATVGQELCRQGDEADRLWLLASGRLVALRHKEEPQHVVAPALVGESLLLAIDVPQCRHRPWTLRAASPCHLWEIRLEDLSRVVQIYPAVRLCLLDYVRKDLVKFLWACRAEPDAEPPAPAPPEDQEWCELVALMQTPLLELNATDPIALDELCEELSKATIEDGSLQARLSVIVDAAMVRDGLTPEALLGLPLPVQQQAAAAQRLQRQTRSITQDAVGRPSMTQDAVGRPSVNGGRQGSGAPAAAAPAGPGPRPRDDGDSHLLHRAQTAGGGGGGGYGYPPRRPTFHDPHHGPAPWGITTEDAIASSGRFGRGPPPPPPSPPSRQLQLPLPPAPPSPHKALQKDSSNSWNSRASPSRPSTALLPLPPSPVRTMRRGASRHHQALQDADAAAAGGGSGSGRHRSAAGGGGAATGSGSDTYADSELTEASAWGLATPEGGICRTATPPPAASAVPPDLFPDGATAPRLVAALADTATGTRARSSPPPSSPPPPLEIGDDDPIAAETGVVSPRAQQRLSAEQQQRQAGQVEQPAGLPPPPTRTAVGLPPPPPLPPPPSSFLPEEADESGMVMEGRLGEEVAPAADTAAAASTAAAGGLRQMSGLPGPPPMLIGPSGTRRSMLSRMSSPFATISPAAVMAGGGGGGVAAMPAAPPPARPASGATGGANGAGSWDGRTLGAAPGGCAVCGSHCCPHCGAWTSAAAPQPPGHPNHPPLPPPSALPAISSGGGYAPAPAGTSLLDAMRGRGGGGGGGAAAAAAAATGGGIISGVGAGSLNRRSAMPLGGTIHEDVPPSSGQWLWPAAASGGGGGAPGSPTSALARRSRMFGRSLAATARADSLVRTTLQRETMWSAYTVQREEDELASASVPVRETNE